MMDSGPTEATQRLWLCARYLPETARLLGRALRGKTVVLTGAMVPYKFGSSDGMFNLGSALSFAQTLPPGVYIAMNGRYFNSLYPCLKPVSQYAVSVTTLVVVKSGEAV